MRVVFASLGAYGHLYPLLPLALACRDAGHQVTVATGAPFLDRLPLPTVPSYPADLTLQWAEQETQRRHPELQGVEFAAAMFGDAAAGAVLPEMLARLTELEADLVVYEPTDVGAAAAADLLGIPALAFATGLIPSLLSILHPAAIGYQAEQWTARGRTPPDRRLLGEALLDICPVSLQTEYTDAPRVPVRSVAYSPAEAEIPGWLTEDPGRPRVYVTLGTVSFGAVEVLQRTVAEIATLGVDVLVTVGPDGDPAALGPQPENVHVERFVAQSAVLPRVDLIAHHGGTGTVLAALENGLPQLILPQGADQPFNADLLVRRGAAASQPNDAYRPGSIAALVEPLLGPCAERDVAQRIRAEIAAMPAPAEVVGRVEAFATG